MPGSRAAQDRAIDEAIGIAEEVVRLRERLQGPDSHAGRTWAAAGGTGEWWELVEARHFREGWKRMRGVSVAGRAALGVAAMTAPSFEEAMHQGRWDEALAMAQQQSAALEANLGPGHPYSLRSRLNAARAMNSSERYADAITALGPLVEAMIASLGRHHPDTLSAQRELGLAYWWVRRNDEALRLARTVLDGRKIVLGPDHIDTLNAGEELFYALDRMDHHDEQVHVASELHRTSSLVFGKGHWRTLRAARLLALAKHDLGQYRAAADVTAAALAEADEPATLEYARDPLTLLNEQSRSQNRLAEELRNNRDPSATGAAAELVATVRRRLALMDRFEGLATEPERIEAESDLAEALHHAGLLTESGEAFERAIERFTRTASGVREAIASGRPITGSSHMDTLQAGRYLFWSLNDADRHDALLRVATELHNTCRSMLGGEHWRTVEAAARVAYAKQDLGQHRAAADFAADALAEAGEPPDALHAKEVIRLLQRQEHSLSILASNSRLADARRRDGSQSAPAVAAELAATLRTLLALAGRFEGIVGEPERIIARADLAEALHHAGTVRESNEQFDRALDEFRQSTPGVRGSLKAMQELGSAAVTLSRLPTAAELLDATWRSALERVAGSDPLQSGDLAGVPLFILCSNYLKVLGAQGEVDAAAERIAEWARLDSSKRPGEEQALWQSLGLTLGKHGWHEHAVRVWRQRLADTASGIDGVTEDDTEYMRGQLASALLRAGHNVEAEHLERELHAAAVAAHGDTSPEAIRRLNSLAYALSEMGKLNEAIELNRRAVALSELANVGDTSREIYATNLGESLREAGYLSEAEQVFRAAFERRRAKLGDSHELTIEAAIAVADAASDLGRYDEAVALLEKCKSLASGSGVPDAKTYRKVRSLLITLLPAVGRTTEALALADERLAERRREAPFGGTLLVDALVDAAANHSSIGSYARGRELLSEARTVADEQLDRLDLRALRVLRAQLEFYRSLGDREPLLEVAQEFFSRWNERLSAEGWPATQHALQGLELLLALANEVGEQHNEFIATKILPNLDSALAGYRVALGSDNPSLRRLERELADFHAARGEYDRATALLRERVQWAVDRYGPDDVVTLSAKNNLAITLHSAGNLGAASDILEGLLSHPSIEKHTGLKQNVRWNVATLRADQARHREVIEQLGRIASDGTADLHGVRHLAMLPVAQRRERFRSIANQLAFTIRTGLMHESGHTVALDAVMRRKYLLHELASVEVATARASLDPNAGAALSALARAQVRLSDAAGSGVAEPDVVDRLERAVRDAERDARFASPVLGVIERRLGQGINDIAAQLASDEALVEFVKYRPTVSVARPGTEVVAEAASFEQYGVFILRAITSSPSGHTIRFVDLGPAEPLEATVRRFRDRISVSNAWVRDEALSPAERGLSRQTAASLDELRRVVWDPLETHVQGARRLFVSMDGALHGVPLEVCVRVDELGIARFLIEWPDAPEIAYVGSGRELLRDTAEGRRRGEGFVAFVDPDFDAPPLGGMMKADGGPAGEQLAPVTVRPHESVLGIATLSGSVGAARFERIWERDDTMRAIGSQFIDHVRALDRLSPGSPSRPALLQSSNASEQSWRALFPERGDAQQDPPVPEVLIFTTHGLFNDPSSSSLAPDGRGKRGADAQRPDPGTHEPLLGAGLALAGYNAIRWPEGVTRPDNMKEHTASEGDGLLTALEIAATDLQGVRIAILTACHSGEGRQESGEAAVGLRAGLSIAGVPAGVAALWAVPTDVSTRFTMGLMTRIIGPHATAAEGGGQTADDLTRFRLAQRELLERVRKPRSSSDDPLARGNAHPFWWAGFVFQGRPHCGADKAAR